MATSSTKFDGENANEGGGKKRQRFRTCTTKLENIIKFCEINEINWQDNYTLRETVFPIVVSNQRFE